MSATIAAYDAVMKQVWTSDRLEEQLYQDNPFWDTLERTDRFHVGKEARVPLHKGRSGGYSVKPAAGGALNAPDEQKVDAAVYNYTHHYFQVELESAAIDQTDTNAVSAANVVDVEVSGAVADLKKQITRQAFSNGDALIARCTTSSGTAVINLLNTGYGFDAIERGWLYPGLLVDIGTTSSEASLVADAEILAVSENSTTPTITIGTAITTSSSHYVSVANARSGSTSYEMNGLKLLIGGTSAVGGLNPATAGQEFWTPANVDSSTTTLGLDAMYTMARKIRQKTGSTTPNVLITSLVNQQRLYNLLQMQVRFAGDNVGAGNVDNVTFAGQKIMADPDCPNKEAYWISTKHLFLLNKDKPHWQNKHTGGQILEYKQGYTSFVATLMYRVQLGTDRRNAHAAMTGITA